MTARLVWAIAGFALLLPMMPLHLQAHHSFAAVFDEKATVKLQGTVTKLEWMNPHIYTHIEAKDSSGKTIVYEVEGGAPNSLFRSGWRPDSLKAGDTVTVTGRRAKSEKSYRVGSATITKADGTRVFGGGGGGAAAQQ